MNAGGACTAGMLASRVQGAPVLGIGDCREQEVQVSFEERLQPTEYKTTSGGGEHEVSEVPWCQVLG